MKGSLTLKTAASGSKYYYVNLLYKDQDGRWKCKQVATHLPEKGNKKRARAMIPALVEKYQYLEASVPANPELSASMTLCDYLEYWLTVVKPTIRTSTYEGYEYRVRSIKRYFEPTGMKLREVKPRDVDEFFRYELEKGKISQKDGSLGPLAPRTVREFRNILKLAFTHAIIDGLVKSNPCLDVHVRGRNLSTATDEYLFLSEKEVTELLDFLRSTRPFLMPIAFFGIYYGLRRSEILGLHWSDIDLKKNCLHIRNTVVRVKTVHEERNTKTDSSCRDLQLFPTAIRCLQKVREKQEQDKRFFKGDYQNTGLVFCWEDGHPYDPNYLTRTFNKATKEFGRPEITLHKLRHTCASLLIDRGWNPKKLQHWLGHADIETTLNVYAHYQRCLDNGDSADLSAMSDPVKHLFEDDSQTDHTDAKTVTDLETVTAS